MVINIHCHGEDLSLSPECFSASRHPAYPHLSTYTYACPQCGEVTRKADSQHLAVLATAGVPIEVVDVPAEVLEHGDGPALTSDDLLDLALALGRTDLLAIFADTMKENP